MANLPLKDQYILLRSRIEHGDNLVNHRLTWWLASQGALYTAFFSVWHGNDSHRVLFMHLLAAVGALVSILSMMSLIGHFRNVEMLRRFWKARSGVTDHAGTTINDFPHIAYDGKWWGSGAHVAALGMPILSVVLWVVLAGTIWLK